MKLRVSSAPSDDGAQDESAHVKQRCESYADTVAVSFDESSSSSSSSSSTFIERPPEMGDDGNGSGTNPEAEFGEGSIHADSLFDKDNDDNDADAAKAKAKEKEDERSSSSRTKDESDGDDDNDDNDTKSRPTHHTKDGRRHRRHELANFHESIARLNGAGDGDGDGGGPPNLKPTRRSRSGRLQRSVSCFPKCWDGAEAPTPGPTPRKSRVRSKSALDWGC